MEDDRSNDYIVEMKGISKRFGSIQALTKVDLELRKGEILGLVGDNGAGKSTLMKILYGAYHADEGEIFVEGQRVELDTPRDAQALGIAMIYQDLALFNNLDVAANVFTGREYTRRLFGAGLLDQKRMHVESAAVIDRLKVNIPSTKLLVEKMSGGQRQIVACARAIGRQANVLIMDEPTSELGVKESATLLDLVATFRDQGLAIVFITHRIPDILSIGDRILALKGGKRVGVLEVDQCTLEDIVTLIVRGRANGAEK